MIPRTPPRALAAVLISTALLVSGCKGEPEEEAEAPLRPLDVMEEVSKAKYTPPADGRLTEKQVEMYLAVKKREREIREESVGEMEEKAKAQEKEGGADLEESMRSVGDVVGLTMADLRAALELGHNPKEYTWVEERVAEAQVAEANEVLNERVDRNRAQYLEMLEEERKGATTGEHRAEIDRQIEEFKRRPDNAAPASPAVQHNVALLAKHKEDLLEAQFGDAVAAAGRSTDDTSQEKR